MVQSAQYRLETLPRYPQDTLQIHSTLMGRLVGSEGTNSEKHTLSVYFATATDGYLPWNRDIFLVEDCAVFFFFTNR